MWMLLLQCLRWFLLVIFNLASLLYLVAHHWNLSANYILGAKKHKNLIIALEYASEYNKVVKIMLNLALFRKIIVIFALIKQKHQTNGYALYHFWIICRQCKTKILIWHLQCFLKQKTFPQFSRLQIAFRCKGLLVLAIYNHGEYKRTCNCEP